MVLSHGPEETDLTQPITLRGADSNCLKADFWEGEGDYLAILLHGGGQTRHSWRRATAALLSRGYAVLSYDARGHGDSEWIADGDYRYQAHGEDLRHICDGFAASKRIVLIGASMGGMAALYAAGHSKAHIAALVLVDIVPWPVQAGADSILAFMKAHGEGFESHADALQAVGQAFPDRQSGGNVARIARNLRKRENGRFYWHWDPRLLDHQGLAEAIVAEGWVERATSTFLGPTLVLKGAISDVIDEQGIARLRCEMPQLESRSIPGAGHMIVGDNNDAFNDAVAAFLDAHLDSAFPT
ncbi:putative hydrolase [Sphingobium sp. TA15]|uniref:Peroxiredoxin n=2 Tax=Sphingomonadaceae TaxID=41297 RepID=D4Z0V6_SPHIU|nr:peroxiredoxin [Sphingobium indicum UT26S]BDD65539.1 putative hydrolase [Sphingobium sp. TA15]